MPGCSVIAFLCRAKLNKAKELNCYLESDKKVPNLPRQRRQDLPSSSSSLSSTKCSSWGSGFNRVGVVETGS